MSYGIGHCWKCKQSLSVGHDCPKCGPLAHGLKERAISTMDAQYHGSVFENDMHDIEDLPDLERGVLEQEKP